MAAAGAGQAALPTLRRGPHGVGDRRLDSAGRAVVAGVPPERLDLPPGSSRLPAQHLLPAARPARRARRRPAAAPAGADRHRPRPGGPRPGSGADGARGRAKRRGLSRGGCADRHCQRLRDAGAADALHGHRRGARPGDQRDRRQRHGVQSRADGGAGDCGRAARLRLGGVVLRHQCVELRGHHRRAPRHAPAAGLGAGCGRRAPRGLLGEHRGAHLVSGGALSARQPWWRSDCSPRPTCP